MRFIDNFSTGSRGSKSVECFLEDKYAVIFMHRKGSIEPFAQLKELLTKGQTQTSDDTTHTYTHSQTYTKTRTLRTQHSPRCTDTKCV